MEWVNNLYGQTVGIDTAPLIYYIEQHSSYIERLRPFFTSLDRGDFQVVTSTVTLLEVLVHPLRRGDEALAHRYNDILLSSPNISTLPVTYATAQEAAELRARHNLKTPDAIQLAVALSAKATIFLTNDRDFPRIDGMTVLRLLDIAKGD
jgi:predicted nucleic acid-binding protein